MVKNYFVCMCGVLMLAGGVYSLIHKHYAVGIFYLCCGVGNIAVCTIG